MPKILQLLYILTAAQHMCKSLDREDVFSDSSLAATCLEYLQLHELVALTEFPIAVRKVFVSANLLFNSCIRLGKLSFDRLQEFLVHG